MNEKLVQVSSIEIYLYNYRLVSLTAVGQAGVGNALRNSRAMFQQNVKNNVYG